MATSSWDDAQARDSVHEQRFESFAPSFQWWMNFTSGIPAGDLELVSRRNAIQYVQAAYGVQVENPTPQDLGSVNTSLTASVRECWFKLTNKEARDSKRATEQMMDFMMRAAFEQVSDSMFTVFSTLDSTTHPLNAHAAITASGGGTAFACDNLVITHLDGTTTTQANTATTAFSRTAIRANITAHHKFVGLNKRRIPSAGTQPFVIAPIDLSATTDEVKGLINVVDSSGLEVPVIHRLEGAGVLESPHFSTADANDWWTVWANEVTDLDGQKRMVGPIRPWIRLSPTVEQTDASGSHHQYFSGEVEYGIEVDPFIHTSVYMNVVA